MNEINIKCGLESPQDKNTNITLSIEAKPEEGLLYKFIVGSEGTWKNLKDYSEEGTVNWLPTEDGRYIIMVQAKHKGSGKPFDYVSRMDYVIGKIEEKVITNVFLEKNKLNVGEKISVNVEANKMPVVYRFWVKFEDNWQLIRDYSADNTLKWSVKKPGKHELLVECKHPDSKKSYDDFMKAEFEVLKIRQVEIKDFKCLSSDMLVDSEMIFQVDAFHEDNRLILYKFIKINSEGAATCIQDYSTKRMVSFVEKNSGNYKLLCMAKDMYSQNEYDDRALIAYNVKLYDPISIQSFTTDLSSPQIGDTSIELKAVVKGGRNLLYRFIIDGNYGEDSGYTRNNSYSWLSKKSGKYKILLWVKDASFEGSYEASSSLDFTIDEVSDEPVEIKEVILDKSEKLLKGETVNVKAVASGGTELRYSFIVKKDDKQVESIDYGTCNWVNFTPEEAGIFQLEVRVRDKYSQREYDAHNIIYLEVYDFIPASIDYVLLPSTEFYLAGDTVTLNIITQNTSDIIVNYVLKINGHKVEETGFCKNKKYSFTPNYSGEYVVEIFAKNKLSNCEFDCKKDAVISVKDALPITYTKIQCDRLKIVCREAVNFTVNNEGGKEVVYEFYIYEKNDWNLVQRYSRKNYYCFIPFVKGKYRMLALCKSQHNNCAYEDYDIFEFNVEE